MTSGAAKSTTQERVEARPTCYRCFRPESLCCCEAMPRLANRTRVVIVQHPRERFHPVGTARLAVGSLERCELVTGPLRTLGQGVERLGLSRGAAVLFPSADARTLEELTPDEFPETVVVLDGTWHCAKTLLRELPELASLPRVRFTPEQESNYRIRKEPRPIYLSTIESIAHVLGHLEPALDVDALHEIFREMIDRNIAARRPREGTSRARVRGRNRPYEPPPALLAPRESLAIVYGEGVRAPLSRSAGASARAPWIVGAFLPDSGESMRVIVRREGVPAVRLAHGGLDEQRYAAEARDEDTARDQLAKFLGERRWVAFHPSSLELLEGLGLKAPAASEPGARSSLTLKGCYCDASRALGEREQGWGSLEDILAREGLGGALTGISERAERRLRGAAELFEFLRSRFEGRAEP